VPTGKVTFLNKSKVLCVVTLNDQTPDQAQCEVASGKVGSLTVTASYAGSFGYTASTSNAVVETVTAAQTTTVVSADPTSSVTGQALTIAAQVSAVAPSSGTPSGTLQFAVETAQGAAVTCSGSKSLSKGIAHCTLPLSVLTPADSPLSITASYAGSTSFQPSSDSTRAHIGIDGSAVSVKSSANPAPSGNKVTLTATVTAQKPGAGVPQGDVTFSFAPSGPACQGSDTVPLTAKGTAACVLPKGVLTSAVTVTASYAGSVAYSASSGMLDQQVKAQKAALPGSFLTLVRMRNA
jgi:VCBS repeat-containing protein